MSIRAKHVNKKKNNIKKIAILKAKARLQRKKAEEGPDSVGTANTH